MRTVLIGVTNAGRSGFWPLRTARQLKQDWLDLLRDLKKRWLTLAPNLAIGDSALGQVLEGYRSPGERSRAAARLLRVSG
ncbi:MAG: hypothetical protein BroJett024_42830 [Alphaproteobacteria bacterium]|nr:MAG: hypothetical protein BroJett024_42830 [Alphaproteobacteria bacterium]